MNAPSALDGSEEWEAVLVAAWREGQRRSMVGPGDPAVHLHHARTLASRLTPPQRAADLGSGAGIPGLALAGIWPRSQWVLVDAAQRRISLLEDTIGRLGWTDRVQAVHGRAEDLAHERAWRGQFELVTARSFGPPAATAECGAGFLRLGGILAVTEPPGADGRRWPADGLSRLALVPWRTDPGLQQLCVIGELDERYPRRSGVPTKRPLF